MYAWNNYFFHNCRSISSLKNDWPVVPPCAPYGPRGEEREGLALWLPEPMWPGYKSINIKNSCRPQIWSPLKFRPDQLDHQTMQIQSMTGQDKYGTPHPIPASRRVTMMNLPEWPLYIWVKPVLQHLNIQVKFSPKVDQVCKVTASYIYTHTTITVKKIVLLKTTHR